MGRRRRRPTLPTLECLSEPWASTWGGGGGGRPCLPWSAFRSLGPQHREEEEEADPAYLGVPFGALGLNIGSTYGALALWRPGTPYGALGNVVLPYTALQNPYTPPTGCNNPFGWNIPCTNLNSGLGETETA